MNKYYCTIGDKEAKAINETIEANSFSEACEALIKIAEKKGIEVQGIMIVRQGNLK